MDRLSSWVPVTGLQRLGSDSLDAAKARPLRLWPLLEQHIPVNPGLCLPRQFRSSAYDSCRPRDAVQEVSIWGALT